MHSSAGEPCSEVHGYHLHKPSLLSTGMSKSVHRTNGHPCMLLQFLALCPSMEGIEEIDLQWKAASLVKEFGEAGTPHCVQC